MSEILWFYYLSQANSGITKADITPGFFRPHSFKTICDDWCHMNCYIVGKYIKNKSSGLNSFWISLLFHSLIIHLREGNWCSYICANITGPDQTLAALRLIDSLKSCGCGWFVNVEHRPSYNVYLIYTTVRKQNLQIVSSENYVINVRVCHSVALDVTTRLINCRQYNL